MDKPFLTLIGDRQTGKTHTALLLAICQACLGDQVLYTCFNGQYAEQLLRGAEGLVMELGLPVDRICRSGGWSIRFRSGGALEFHGPRRSGASKRYDLQVLDDDGMGSRTTEVVSDRVVRIVGTSY